MHFFFFFPLKIMNFQTVIFKIFSVLKNLKHPKNPLKFYSTCKISKNPLENENSSPIKLRCHTYTLTGSGKSMLLIQLYSLLLSLTLLKISFDFLLLKFYTIPLFPDLVKSEVRQIFIGVNSTQCSYVQQAHHFYVSFF